MDLSKFLEWTASYEVLGNSLRTYLTALFFLFLTWVLAQVARLVTSRVLPKLVGKTKAELDDRLLEGAAVPLSGIAALPGLYLVVNVFQMPAGAKAMLVQGIWAALAVLITVILVRSIDIVFRYGLQDWVVQHAPDVDIQVLNFGRQISKVVVFVLVGITILQQFGLDVFSLITGLGIGGLAVALAAQETLGNLLGSVQILTDRPFTAGDFIRFNGIFGQVDEVGVRSTKLLTGRGVKVIVPNKLLAESVVENCSTFVGLTVTFEVGLEYSTPAAELERASSAIKTIVRSQSGVDEDVLVHFLGFGAFSLDLRVTYYVTDLPRHLEIRHDINLAIKAKFDEAGWGFAFPTQTLHIASHAKS
jgi:MscS family membrane protein